MLAGAVWQSVQDVYSIQERIVMAVERYGEGAYLD